MTRRAIMINGTSSSGKSVLASALQAELDGCWLNTGVDQFTGMLHSDWWSLPGLGHEGKFGREGARMDPQPDGTLVVSLGPEGRRLTQAMRTAIRAMIDDGHKVIVDMVLLDDVERAAWCATLPRDIALWVGVYCPLEVAEERERARGDRQLGMVRAQHATVHDGVEYEITVDTNELAPAEAAQLIAAAL